MSAATKVSVEIDRHVFEKLQSLAEPLIDDPSSVIEKLITHWKENPPTQGAKKNPGKWWVSARGEKLPVGLELRARYGGETYKAKILSSGILFQSETFNSPSAAAIHVKNISGLVGNSANTNGWRFWEYYDEESGVWRDLELFRKQGS
ncbi:MAG TPA: hypothetical protein VF268_14180 [Gammaproteobacteria bacterium]